MNWMINLQLFCFYHAPHLVSDGLSFWRSLHLCQHLMWKSNLDAHPFGSITKLKNKCTLDPCWQPAIFSMTSPTLFQYEHWIFWYPNAYLIPPAGIRLLTIHVHTQYPNWENFNTNFLSWYLAMKIPSQHWSKLNNRWALIYTHVRLVLKIPDWS